MSATMFRAVVWKELRENLKWAVVVLLGMAAGLLYSLKSLAALLRGTSTTLGENPGGLDATTAIGGIVAGLLLGTAQSIAENRGDKWGFLTHRPVDRSTLFWGKATAGILLYVISTGVAVVGALFWMATPGHLPMPFDWQFALPIIANLLGGLVFYFAGILTGMREARWYASRALGIGAGVWFFGLQMAAPTFWQAVAASAAGLVVIGTAAWSTFVAGGQYGTQTRIGRAATGVSIGLGVALVGIVLFVITYSQLRSFEPPQELVRSRYTLTTDGIFARVVSRNNRIVEISDLDGRPLEQYRQFLDDPAFERRLSEGVLSARLSLAPRATPSFRSTESLFSLLNQDVNGRPVRGYYVHRLNLIATYDIQTGNLIGWLGPDGFSLGNSRPRPFAGSLMKSEPWNRQKLLVLDSAVYRLDLQQRQVELAFQAEHGEVLLDAASQPQFAGSQPQFAGMLPSNRTMAGFDIITTTQRVVVQGHEGTRLLEARHDAAARGYPQLMVSRAMQAPGIPTFLWYQGNFGKESRIYKLDGTGAVLTTHMLPSTEVISRNSWPETAITAAMSPLIGQALLELTERKQPVEPSMSGPPESVRWALAILSSIVFATAVFLRGRKYAFRTGRLHAWTWIGFLFGPLGYLMMLALIEWPARAPCPACSRKRVVIREHCEHCGEPFAAPPQDGTEIFEPMPARPP